MRSLFLAVAAGAALTAAMPAAAQSADYYACDQGQRGYYGDRDDGYYGNDRGRGDFTGWIDCIDRMIDQGVREGSLERRQADIFYDQLRNISRRAGYQQNRGTYDRGDTAGLLRNLQQRIASTIDRGRERGYAYGDDYDRYRR